MLELEGDGTSEAITTLEATQENPSTEDTSNIEEASRVEGEHIVVGIVQGRNYQ